MQSAKKPTSKLTSRPIFALTTGDEDGIGLEVTLKALKKNPLKSSSLIVFTGDKLRRNDLKSLLSICHLSATTLAEAISIAKASKNKLIIHLASPEAPAKWVEQAARACMEKKLSGIITGPLSKTGIKQSGIKDMGHTEILKRISGAKAVHMSFVGKEFSVVLATGHLALKDVAHHIHFKSLSDALLNSRRLLAALPRANQKKPLAILGLNPHAGESGLLGEFEGAVFPAILDFAKENGLKAVGPLVPDAAFLPQTRSAYSLYIALYHDQGLIPFKTIHGQDGVHISLGLPFVRTSVDHGTAKDIFGKNKADPTSMKSAIEWAERLVLYSKS